MGLRWVNTHKQKKKRQYTKLVMDLVLGLTLITTLASIYINFKNGMGLDGIVANCWDGLKYIIPSYCAKSYFETKEEHKYNGVEDDVEC
ncbi:hypothetical protein [Niameybacter massiliensis]|uniref:hypothetical protein n=1 Tax=Niameybacter massiliensis TaxID=1658108 RepID=UPI0006B401D8|nr:hypothetical protein [Niameybacter massiliensis]